MNYKKSRIVITLLLVTSTHTNWVVYAVATHIKITHLEFNIGTVVVPFCAGMEMEIECGGGWGGGELMNDGQ